MSILSEERKRGIMERLRLEGRVKVADLAAEFAVSEETVRRDLELLGRDGLLKRVYGGAIAANSFEPPYMQRLPVRHEEKRRIGIKAAKLLRDGDTIAIDVGTTALELAKAIRGLQRLTVLTNSLAVAAALMDSLTGGVFTGKVIVIGGEMNPEQQSLTGVLSEWMMERFRVDKAFLSTGGITLEGGVSDYDLAESDMSRRFAEAARFTCVLADGSKLGRNAFVRIVPLERVDAIVSEAPMPREWSAFAKQHRLQWIMADGEEPERTWEK